MTDRLREHEHEQQHERQADELDPARDLDFRGPVGHGSDSTARVRRLRPPAWDWSFAEDGALALDRHELWEEPVSSPEEPVLQAPEPPSRLNSLRRFGTVNPMSPPRSPGTALRRHRAERRAARRTRRLAAVALIAIVLVVTLLLTAFGSGTPAAVQSTPPATASTVLPAGPPSPVVVATQGNLQLHLPVAQSLVTAIGYHGSGEASLPLSPGRPPGQRGLLRAALPRGLRRPQGRPHLLPARRRRRRVDG